MLPHSSLAESSCTHRHPLTHNVSLLLPSKCPSGPPTTEYPLCHYLNFLSVQFSCSSVSNSLQPHGLQHTCPPYPSPTPRVYSNSCLLSRWCHQSTSFSVVPFSHFQSFPALGSFPMSHFFASNGQNIGVSVSTSVLPMNIQDWFPLGWTGWICLQSKEFSKSSPIPQFKSISSSALSFLPSPTLTSIHDYWKNQSFD